MNNSVPNSKASATTTPKRMVSILGSTWVVDNLYFLLYLALLLVIYIGYGHWTDKTLRAINKTESKVKDLQYEYKTVTNDVMRAAELKTIEGKAAALGLTPNRDMPFKIIADKEEDKKQD